MTTVLPVVVSGPDEAGLTAAARQLGELLADRMDAPLAGVCRGLMARPAQRHRLAVLATGVGEACEALLGGEASGSVPVLRGRAEPRPGPLLMFPGVGDHYPGMAAELYEAWPTFRAAFDECAERVVASIGVDLRDGLRSAPPRPATGSERPGRLRLAEMLRPPAAPGELDRVETAQPLVFTVEYALARLLEEFGVRPAAVLGYSVGEYVAATVAGVFQPAAAIDLVAARAQLIAGGPAGAMSAVLRGAADLAPMLAELGEPGLVVSADDGPHLSVVSGPPEAVAALEDRLRDDGTAVRRLPVDRAFHSPAMDAVAGAMADRVAAAAPSAPRIPMLSNVTGDWLTAERATDARYWAGQVSRPVRFTENLARAWELPAPLFIEVGPGGALTTLALQHPGRPAGGVAVPTLAGRYRAGSDGAALVEALTAAWIHGVPVDLTLLLR